MGAKFICKRFDATDRGTVAALWRLYCEMTRMQWTVRIAIDNRDELVKYHADGEPFAPWDPVPDSVEDDLFVEYLNDVYVIKKQRRRGGVRTWVKLPQDRLASDAKRFQDVWHYGGIPWGCGETFKYLEPKKKIKGVNGVVTALQDLPKCSLGAIEHGGATFIGGWVPW